MNQFEVLIQDCENCIRSGHPHKVAKLLADINLSRTPAEWRLPLAKICRRAGLYANGLKLLNKVLDPPQNEPVSNSDKAEYSALLVRSGAISEALDRLATVDSHEAPEALLFRAYAYFSLRQYQAAIQCLENYLATPLTEYASLVARTNLGFAYAGSRNQELALKVLTENIRLTNEGGYRQLQGTCFALRAQVQLQLKNFTAAREDLKSAQGSSDMSHTNDNFLAVQWQLVVDGLESKSLAPLDHLRTIALAHQNWEACREADFYSLHVKPNRERLVYLYCGTPFPEFRDIIHNELGERPTQPIYVYGNKSHPRLDMQTGHLDGKEFLPFAGRIHQLLEVLLRDFYQQPRIAGLFSALFPGEHFDVSTSPPRVHQLIWRTREWMRIERLPLQIVEINGFYSLRIVGALSFRVPLERKTPDLMEYKFSQLTKAFAADHPFTASEARKILGLSKTTVHEFLHWAVELGKIKYCNQTKRANVYVIGIVTKDNAA